MACYAYEKMSLKKKITCVLLTRLRWNLGYLEKAELPYEATNKKNETVAYIIIYRFSQG